MKATVYSLRRIPILACLLLIGLPTASQAEEPDTEAAFAKLRSKDMDVRIEGLRALMTSLDPHLPGALFPLLSDEGNSTRRLAARAVGSRWWQIADARKPAFVKALKKNAASDREGEANMAKRAIGLLERDYSGPMFSRSPNKRWVIYERRGLPCLIDTENDSEELLGWSPAAEDHAWLDSSWGNGPLEGSVLWHPEFEAVALSIVLDRRVSTVWLWQHKGDLTKLSANAAVAILGHPPDSRFKPGGFYATVKGWAGKARRPKSGHRPPADAPVSTEAKHSTSKKSKNAPTQRASNPSHGRLSVHSIGSIERTVHRGRAGTAAGSGRSPHRCRRRVSRVWAMLRLQTHGASTLPQYRRDGCTTHPAPAA